MTDDILDGFAAKMGDDAVKLAMLSDLALRGKRRERAYALARRARALAPDDPEVAVLTAHAISQSVWEWHVPMLQETERNDLYDAAIRAAVRPGMRVLDIGTGTGLLAMMAARAGAEAVTTCERVTGIADAAQDIVALNGYADRIAVHNVLSTALDPQRDLGGPVDLVVSEILGSDLIGESVLPTLRDAIRRLLKPGGTMIPAGGEVRVALAQWDGPPLRIDVVSGFDVRPFNAIGKPSSSIPPDNPQLALRSEPATLFAFDFTAVDTPVSGAGAVRLEATGGGANGFVQWIRIQLDESHVYENLPGVRRRSGWSPSFYPFDAPLAAGEHITVQGRHNETELWLWRAAQT